MKQFIFGFGPTAERLVFDFWSCRLEWKLADLWVGAFWKKSGHCLDVWVCLLPCIPLHLCFVWHDPLQ
jgi:hypothetical protein